MTDIVGVGALNLDFIYEIEDINCARMADLDIKEGKEIVAADAVLSGLRDRLNKFGTLKKMSLGGSASNTCHVLALMGYDTGMIGVLGADREGDFYLSHALYDDERGVVRKGRTGMAYIINARNRDRSIVLFPHSNSAITEEDIDVDVVRSTKWVHMSSFAADGAVEVQRKIKTLLPGKASFSIDPGEIYARKGKAVHSLIEGAAILFATENELEMLFGAQGEKAIREALQLAKIVVLKKGTRGASLHSKDVSVDAAAEKVRVVDNTGAGDVLNGVFLGLYMKGLNLSSALHVATRAASLSTTGYGRDTYPTRRDIEFMYQDAERRRA
ncbi:MAG: carbohydrate kinase family protein [Syntrophorhabdus aromaticivorans]|uniref:Carbohydrate kinase family protein n=1 Tax=Syntrophorhabdus aromaticivorans TaxID=328301 RepID=A0A971M441_9BACT|nr:carbohydrate kinase family protein [Syntrophorhabdus aromaticivorans]